jgi:hypothetical protein
MAYVPVADERAKALGDVYYEIQQLAAAALVGIDHPNLNNAVIESRLLHVRTLLDFFERDSCNQDDVLASHYGFPAAVIGIEEPYRQRLNKDLAHLTYSRTRRTQADKNWPHERVIMPVLERSRSFIDHVLATLPVACIPDAASWQDLRAGVTRVITMMGGHP